MKEVAQKILLGYSVVMTTVIAITLAVAHGDEKPISPSILTVQQLRVVEPDGTLRTVISNKTLFPAIIVAGKDYSSKRNSAGMLFYDDEGSEIGGLIYSGRRNESGNASNAGSLTFDRYQKDQVVQLVNLDDEEGHWSGLIVTDRTDTPQNFEGWKRYQDMPAGPMKTAERKRLKAADPEARRLFVGRDNGDAILQLNDGQGVPRLQFVVKQDGEASIQFLDGAGKVTKTVTPNS